MDHRHRRRGTGIVTYDLSGVWDYIERVARIRLSKNKTAFHVSDYGDYLETIGAAGELAAQRFFGLGDELHLDFDGGHDFALGGFFVDVKATILTPRLKYRYLQWPHWKPCKADIILLTAVDQDSKVAKIVGYAMHDEVMSAPINLERKIPCHEISTMELHDPKELLTLPQEDQTQRPEYFVQSCAFAR